MLAFIHGKFRFLSLDGSSMETCVSAHFLYLSIIALISRSCNEPYTIRMHGVTNPLENKYTIETKVDELLNSSIVNYIADILVPSHINLIGCVNDV